ncbi:MAG: RICIN domain-containing protein [Blautia sp.]|nr:RICIN domain-containing protein [Blautia sp.]
MKDRNKIFCIYGIIILMISFVFLPEKVSAASIQSGYYVICSSMDNNQALNVSGASEKSGANIQLWKYSARPESVFKISSYKNGYYKITSLNSGNVLNVSGNSKKSKTNLNQASWKGSNGQLWKFISAGNGNYHIQSKLGTYIDAAGGKSKNGTNVWMYNSNKTKSQKWKLKKISNYLYCGTSVKSFSSAGGSSSAAVTVIGNWKVSSNSSWLKVSKGSSKIYIKCSKNTGASRKGTITLKCGSITKNITVSQNAAVSSVSNGTYFIESAINNNYVLDVNGASSSDGANVQLWSKANVNQKKFTITKVSGEYYKITAAHSDKVLDVANGSKASGTNVWQCSYNGTSAQLWRFVPAGNGYYYIQSKLGTYLDAANGKAENGNNVWACTGNKTKAQKWKLCKTTISAKVKNGLYTIGSSINTFYVLDVAGVSGEDCANIQLWGRGDVNHQKFYFINETGEYYKIVAAHSNKVLDVANGSKSSGTNVWQCTYNGTDAQLWRFVSAGNGYYYIQSKLGTYLDAANGQAGNGINVWACTGNKTNAQKWKLTPTKLAQNISSGIRLSHHMNISMRQGDYSAFTVPYGYNAGCCATAYAVGLSIVKGKSYNPTLYWHDGPYGYCTYFDAGGVDTEKTYNATTIYNALKRGKPTMLHYAYANNSGEHWVLIIGVRSGANENNLSYSDFIVIDPASGLEKSLTSSYKFAGGKVKGMKVFL